MGRTWLQTEPETQFWSYQNATPIPIKKENYSNESALTYEQADVDSSSLKEVGYRSQFHIASLTVPTNTSDCYTPRIIVYDRQRPTKRSTLDIGISYKSNVSLSSVKVSKFHLFDIPSRIAKPNRSDSYRRFLESKRNHFDNNIKCFILHNHNEPRFSGSLGQKIRPNFTKSDFQIVLNLLPCIKYGNIGFIFSCETFDKFLDNLKQLLTIGRHEANYKIFFDVKIESLRVIDLTSKGKLGKAAILLEVLQEIEQCLEPSEWTAWFYIARFYFMLKFLRKTSSFEFHKDNLYRDLNRARQAFNAEGAECFALERSLLLWWMFLIQADLINFAVDSFSEVPHKYIKHSVSDTIAIKMAQTLLRHFELEKSVLGVYPTQNDEHQTVVDEFAKLHDSTNVTTSRLRVGSKDKHDHQTFSSAGSVTTDEEDKPIELVESRYKQLVKNVYSKCNGRFPSCVQEIAVLYSKKKIVVYSTKPTSKRLKLFLKKIGTSTEECLIQKVSPYEAFTNWEYDQSIIQPGCSLVMRTRAAWENWLKQKKSVSNTTEDKCYGPILEKDAIELGSLGSIGLLWIDTKIDELYLGTSCHGLGTGNWPKQGQDLVILSLRKANDNKSMWMLDEIGSDFTGYYGTMPLGEKKMLVDSLLIRISKELLSKTFVDFSFRNKECKDSTIEMEVYKGDINKIKHLPIYSINMDNGYGEVQGQIINTELGPVNLDAEYVGEHVNKTRDVMPQLGSEADTVDEGPVDEKMVDRSITEIKGGPRTTINNDEATSSNEPNSAVKKGHANVKDFSNAVSTDHYQRRKADEANDHHSDSSIQAKDSVDDNSDDDTDNDTDSDDEASGGESEIGEGAFVIALQTGHHNQNFARKGHSGNLVYFKDPDNPKKYYALGQIWAGARRAYEHPKTLKIYNHVTYCIPLKSTCLYHKPAMILECFVPPLKINNDSGYDSRISASNSAVFECPEESNSSGTERLLSGAARNLEDTAARQTDEDTLSQCSFTV